MPKNMKIVSIFVLLLKKIRNWDMICDYYVEVIKLLVRTKLLCTNI